MSSDAPVRREPAAGAARRQPSGRHRRGRAALPRRRLRGDHDRGHRRRRRRVGRHHLQVVRRQARAGPGHLGAGPWRASGRSRPNGGPTSCRRASPIRARSSAGWGAFTAEIAPRARRSCCWSATAAATDPEARALLEEMDAERLRRMTANARRLRDNGHLRAGVTLDHGRRRAVDVQLAGAVRAARAAPGMVARAVRPLHRRRDDRRPALTSLAGCRTPNRLGRGRRARARRACDGPRRGWRPSCAERPGSRRSRRRWRPTADRRVR